MGKDVRIDISNCKVEKKEYSSGNAYLRKEDTPTGKSIDIDDLLRQIFFKKLSVDEAKLYNIKIEIEEVDSGMTIEGVDLSDEDSSETT